MKHKKQTICAALLAILLVCFVVPSSALAASGLSNDNHTDTDDYCLRAHNVSVNLSEISAKTRAELEDDIIAASAFAFLIRDTVSGTGQFEPITTGYSVDFSNLLEEATSSGYTVTVTLPAISMAEPSRITFRVFVVDDLPHPRAVTYQFESGTAEHTLPDAITAQLPAIESILSGETVTPDAAFAALRDGAGVWSFSGWSPESVTLSTDDVTFTGTWVWTPLPVYTVTYQFVSGSSGRTLPSQVLNKAPLSESGVNGDVFTPPDSFHSYHSGGGVWRFRGWDLSSQTIIDANIVFTGTWRWHEDTITVVETPQPTLSTIPTATPTIALTITAPPSSPSASAPPVQVVEQIDEPTPPQSSNTTGGTAQMMIAAVLTALIASQAFAIASDLKVLKWYHAKKSVRRVKA